MPKVGGSHNGNKQGFHLNCLQPIATTGLYCLAELCTESLESIEREGQELDWIGRTHNAGLMLRMLLVLILTEQLTKLDSRQRQYDGNFQNCDTENETTLS